MMMLSRTPLRVSFFGGGTDYPEHFLEEGQRGAVIGMAINKYIYISILRISGIQPYHFRVSYSKLEHVDCAADIGHNVVRTCLQHYDVREELDINIMSDMPASTGLGSSSAFTVGLVNIMSHMTGQPMTKLDIARQAIMVERDLLHERVGVQDQLHASFGGINRFDFDRSGFQIRPMAMSGACLKALSSSLVLIYTGTTRHASATLDEQIQKTQERKITQQLNDLLALVDDGARVLQGQDADRMLVEFGHMMHEGWLIKRTLSSRISNSEIDALYDKARAHGALGGKLCGAGGGGFLLMVVPPDRREAMVKALLPARAVQVGLDTEGTKLIHI